MEQKDGIYVRLVLTQRNAYLNRLNRSEELVSFRKVADEYEPLDSETIDSLNRNLYEKTPVVPS